MDRRNVPPQYRRQRQRRSNNPCGCSCDCNYARSLQGICKIVAIVILGLGWIVIAASPYWRPIFVIGGETWPFHIVVFICVVVWLATLFMYCLFMSGYHLNFGHYNWPKFELIFNVCAALLVLLAACLEAANVWRWDMRNGNVFSSGANGAYSNYYQYGLRPGMSFTQTLNLGSYCGTRPQDCRDYFSLLAGNNTYHANHIFGTVFLFFAVIAYLVSTYFAYRTYQVFVRDMYKPGELPKPTMWMRFTYQMEQAANYVKGKADKIRGKNDDDEEADVDIEMEKKPVTDDGGFEEVRSSRSEGATSRAHTHSSSHHTSRSHRSRSDHRSRSRSSHRRDTAGRSSRSSSKHRHSEAHSSHDSSERRSRSSSKRKDPDVKPKEINEENPKDPVYDEPPFVEEAYPLSQGSPAGVFPSLSSKKGSKKGKKDAPVDMSPVASVMI